MQRKTNYTEAQWLAKVDTVWNEQLAPDAELPETVSASVTYSLPQGRANIALPSSDRREFNIAARLYAETHPTEFVGLDPTLWDTSQFSIGENFVRPDFANYLEILRQEIIRGSSGRLQRPHINSLFRTKKYNEYLIAKGVPASPNSPHMGGIAIDIGMKTESDRYFVADTAYMLGFGGIAIGSYFVHIDISTKAYWDYEGVPTYYSPTRRKG